MSKRQRSNDDKAIEYVAPPSAPDEELALKISLMMELKQAQERTLELLAPLKEELEQLKTKSCDLREKIKAVNLDIQMKKLLKK